MADDKVSKSATNVEAANNADKAVTMEPVKSSSSILWYAIFNGLIGLCAGMVRYSIYDQAASFEKHFQYEDLSIVSMLMLMETFNGIILIFIMGFLAKHMNIPRVTGMIGIGLGVSMAAPAFLKFVKPYKPIVLPFVNVSHPDPFTCNMMDMNMTIPIPEYSDNFMYKTMFWSAIGSFGFASVLRWGPMAFLYFDNNLPDKRMVGIYLAISTCLAEISRLCSFRFNEYTNGIDPDLKEINPLIPIGAPNFVSAWWLGPMIFGFLTCLVSIPMLFLPANILTSSSQKRQLNKANLDAIVIKGDSLPCTVKEMLPEGKGIKLIIKQYIVYIKSTKRLFKNPMFVLLFVLWGVVILPAVGLRVMDMQYTMYEYNIQQPEAQKADAVTNSVATILSAAVSGLVCTRIHKKRHYLWFILACLFFSFVLLPVSFFLGCDNVPIYGLGNKFGPAIDNACPCDNTPVLLGCGSDGRNYMNPCQAGCPLASPQGVYVDCSSVQQPNGTFFPMICPDDCHDKFVSYNVVFTISTFIHRMADIPKILLALRVIDQVDRGIAFSFLGLSTLMSSLIGPMILVKFFNDNCLLWMTDVICLYFDREGIRLLKTGVEFNTYLFAFVLWFIALRLNNISEKRTKKQMKSTGANDSIQEKTDQLTSL